MNYQETIKKAVQRFYDITISFATSRHFTISYLWVESEFGLDLNDPKVRADVHEMSYSNDFCDLIQALDFDDDKQEVLIMMWKSNNKKKYTLKNYKEFCLNALQAPPIEEFEDGSINEDKWYKENMIHITVGNHDIELGYNADNVNEIEYALREMYDVEYGDSGATTGNTVGSQYRSAELKDIVRIAVQSDWDNFGYKLDGFAEFIQYFIKKEWNIEKIMWYYNLIQKDIKEYTRICQCNFNKLDMSTLCDVNSELIKKTIDELICTDRELLYGITPNNESSDIVFVMDHTLKTAGELIGWFYGQDDIDEEYIDELVDDYKRKLFGEEN